MIADDKSSNLCEVDNACTRSSIIWDGSRSLECPVKPSWDASFTSLLSAIPAFSDQCNVLMIITNR
ncbi:hypothetical protein STEG23_016035, partial [Scotinomys teguina]